MKTFKDIDMSNFTIDDCYFTKDNLKEDIFDQLFSVDKSNNSIINESCNK